jgi:membrane protease YdiL (CAAX protease family)
MESHWSDGAWGLALVAAGAIVVYLVLFILLAAAPDLGRTAAKVSSHPAALSPYIVAAIILVSSFTEEFFVSGYVITALKEKDLLNAGVNASVAIRILTYVDQGALEVVLIIPIALIFATWYARTGKLWPLIVANALINAMNFVPQIKW